MSVTQIVQKGHPALRSCARELTIDEITTRRIQNIIAEMHSVLATQPDGVALAAPQIGEELRIFVISPRAFRLHKITEHLVYINPEILKTSKNRELVDEGCLSVRGLYGRAYRFNQATVSALDEEGRPFTRGASGLLAQIFQHEIDHLNGILFDDHAIDIQKYTPPI